MFKVADLRVGKKYRVVWRPDGGKGTKALVGVYIGINYQGNPLFDLRPHAGTTALLVDEIVGAGIRPGHEQNRLPYRWTD